MLTNAGSMLKLCILRPFVREGCRRIGMPACHLFREGVSTSVMAMPILDVASVVCLVENRYRWDELSLSRGCLFAGPLIKWGFLLFAFVVALLADFQGSVRTGAPSWCTNLLMVGLVT